MHLATMHLATYCIETFRNQKGYSLAPGTYTTRSETALAAWWPLRGPADFNS